MNYQTIQHKYDSLNNLYTIKYKRKNGKDNKFFIFDLLAAYDCFVYLYPVIYTETKQIYGKGKRKIHETTQG